jgi:formylglycine-generating enzyme required for sulfatase activity
VGPRSHGRYERASYVPDASDGFLDTAPVGSFPEDVSPFGALDVMGNVHEWLHTDVPEQGVRGRGGSYLTATASTGTSRYLGPDKIWHVSDIGLRVVIRSP